MIVAKRLSELIEKCRFPDKNSKGRLSIGIGIVSVGAGQKYTPKAIINKVDQALLKTKTSAKNIIFAE